MRSLVEAREITKMHRRGILETLKTYESLFPAEKEMVARIRNLVQTHPDCFDRTCLPGHITGSAWIISPDRSRYLLTHHRKLNRWLQVGGHADSETVPHQVALREAELESGMTGLRFVETAGLLIPLDVDVHYIPPRKSEQAHEHHDLRYFLIAMDGQEISASDESHDVRWFTVDELVSVTDEPGILRMLHKSEQLMEKGFNHQV